MQNLHNVERSAFRKGEYVGYAGGVWRIRRSAGGWTASKDCSSFTRRTLEEISQALDVTAEYLRTA